MAVLKGYIKPLVKSAGSIKLPTKSDDEAEELLSDLCYDAVKSVKGLFLDENPTVRVSIDDKYVEVELVVGGFSNREGNQNAEINLLSVALKKQLGKYLKGYCVGTSKSGERVYWLIMDSQKAITDSDYQMQIQL